MYKIELHTHSREVSPCSTVSVEELVTVYKRAGYHGLVLTNHYLGEYFEKFSPEDFLSVCHVAKEYGDKIGIKVYEGMELRTKLKDDDYLLYGIDLDFITPVTRILDMSMVELREYTKKYGVALFKAHPFRFGKNADDYMYLDGIEAYNLHPFQDSKNSVAVKFALEHNLRMISGTDYHESSFLPRGGILTDHLPVDGKQLARVLLTDNFEVIY